MRYLSDVRKVSATTINHYRGALNTISKFLVEHEKVEKTIYEIEDIGELEVIKTYLYNNPEFITLNTKGHQMYSAGLNNYLRFANGTGFKDIQKQITIMDIKIPISDKKAYQHEQWRRSTIIKSQVIESVNYECEIEASHRTFTARSTGMQYMEGHHALPINLQIKFDCSLDVYANVVCLCPTCHRLLHYGIDTEKQQVLDKIYYDRADRLAMSGIKVSKEEFVGLNLMGV